MLSKIKTMRMLLSFCCIFAFSSLTAQFENASLEEWEVLQSPANSHEEPIRWTTSNKRGDAANPFANVSVTKGIEDDRIFAVIHSSFAGIDYTDSGYIEQKLLAKNLKSVTYTSRCDSIHLLGRCVVQMYISNPNTPLYSDSLAITSNVFEEKEIEIDQDWLQSSDSLIIRFMAEGYQFGLEPKLDGYSVFSIDEVEANYIVSVEDRKLDESILNIYPNPTADVLYLDIDEMLIPHSLEIFDLTGKLVEELAFSSSVSLRHLDKGVYFISVYTKEGKLTKKFAIL